MSAASLDAAASRPALKLVEARFLGACILRGAVESLQCEAQGVRSGTPWWEADCCRAVPVGDPVSGRFPLQIESPWAQVGLDSSFHERNPGWPLGTALGTAPGG